MKIAVCYSGQYRPWAGWIENHKAFLPKADYYYTTWSNQEKFVMNDTTSFYNLTNIINVKNNFIFFEQPIVDYNTYAGEFEKNYGAHVKNIGSERKRLYTANLQHHAHWKALSLCNGYDIIIRMRYDTIIGDHDWYSLCELAYESGKAIGVGNTKASDDYNQNIYKNKPTETSIPKNAMTDFMTIHKKENILNVDNLHKEKNLWPTNSGWYQILSKPGWGHVNFVGGIQLIRYITQNKNTF